MSSVQLKLDEIREIEHRVRRETVDSLVAKIATTNNTIASEWIVLNYFQPQDLNRYLKCICKYQVNGKEKVFEKVKIIEKDRDLDEMRKAFKEVFDEFIKSLGMEFLDPFVKEAMKKRSEF